MKGTCVYAVGGIDASGFLATLEAYSPAANAWMTLPSMPTARAFLGSASAPCPVGATGTCVYAIGGYNGGVLATVEAYSPAANTWITLPSMPTARSGLRSASAPCPLAGKGTCVYAVGGSNGSGFLATFEAYSPATNAWITLPSMPTSRDSMGSASAPCPPGATGTCVYAIGGYNGSGVLATVEAYSPAANAWLTLTLPAMPTARSFLGSASAPCPPGVKGRCVYAVGGYNGSDLTTVEAYSPTTNAWMTLPSMPTARAGLGSASAPCPSGVERKCVYAIGGSNGVANLATVEALIP